MFGHLVIAFNRLFLTRSAPQDGLEPRHDQEEARAHLTQLMASFCTEPGCYEDGDPELDGICVKHALACPDDGCTTWNCNQYHTTGEEGIGTLIVSDAALLVRPRKVPGQYPASVPHDTVHAYNILCLGNDMGEYTTHIVSRFDPKETHKLLDRVFYAFLDACCLQLWCDAFVCYIVDGKTIHVEKYGFEDGQYTMTFNVYCGIAEDQTEEFLATLTTDQTDHFIVVRPDSSDPGYSFHGFTVEQSDEDDSNEPCDEYDDDPYDNSDEDEDPLAGDVEPTGGYYEPSMHPWDAHRLSVMRQHGDYTG